MISRAKDPERPREDEPKGLAIHLLRESGMGGKLVGKSAKGSNYIAISMILAPRAGFEPATNRLTAGCSTAELPGNSLLARWKPHITKPIPL